MMHPPSASVTALEVGNGFGAACQGVDQRMGKRRSDWKTGTRKNSPRGGRRSNGR